MIYSDYFRRDLKIASLFLQKRRERTVLFEYAQLLHDLRMRSCGCSMISGGTSVRSPFLSRILSMTSAVATPSCSIGCFSVVSSGKGWKIVSSANYAPYHQFGTSKMPARPMLPFDKQGNLLDAAKEDVETAMMQGVVKMAKELGFKVKGMK